MGIPRKNPTSVDQNVDSKTVNYGSVDYERERILIAGGNSDTPVDVAVKTSTGNTNNALCVVQTPQADTGAPVQVAVGVGATLLAAANEARKGIVIQNPDSNTQKITIGKSSGMTVGIELYPGGTYSNDTWIGAFYAKSGSGTVNVVVDEELG